MVHVVAYLSVKIETDYSNIATDMSHAKIAVTTKISEFGAFLQILRGCFTISIA